MNMMRDEPRLPGAAGAPQSRRASPPTAEPVPGAEAGSGQPAAAQADRLLPAILLVLASVALFSVGDVLAKLLRQSLPAAEIAWLRYLAFAGLALALAGRGPWLGAAAPPPGCGRGGQGCSSCVA